MHVLPFSLLFWAYKYNRQGIVGALRLQLYLGPHGEISY